MIRIIGKATKRPASLPSLPGHTVTLTLQAGQYSGQVAAKCTCGFVDVSVTHSLAMLEARRHLAGVGG